MKLDSRLKALERSSPTENPVTLVLTHIFTIVPDGPPIDEAGHAIVLPSKLEAGQTLLRADDESEAIAIEIVDLSGRLIFNLPFSRRIDRNVGDGHCK